MWSSFFNGIVSASVHLKKFFHIKNNLHNVWHNYWNHIQVIRKIKKTGSLTRIYIRIYRYILYILIYNTPSDTIIHLDLYLEQTDRQCNIRITARFTLAIISRIYLYNNIYFLYASCAFLIWRLSAR